MMCHARKCRICKVISILNKTFMQRKGFLPSFVTDYHGLMPVILASCQSKSFVIARSSFLRRKRKVNIRSVCFPSGKLQVSSAFRAGNVPVIHLFFVHDEPYQELHYCERLSTEL